MNAILTAVSKAKIGTSVEIAEIAGITPKDAIKELLRLMAEGAVNHKNLLWFIPIKIQAQNRRLSIMEVLAAEGAQTANQIRTITGRRLDSTNSELRSLMIDGLVEVVGDIKGVKLFAIKKAPGGDNV